MAGSTPSASTGAGSSAASTRAGEAAQRPSTVADTQPWPSEVIVLSGASRADLIQAVRRLLALVAQRPELRLVDIGLTYNKSLPADGFRLSIVATDQNDLSRRLTVALESLIDPSIERLRDPSGAYFETAPLAKRGDVALLFPGEGTQYLGMLADLPAHFPEVYERITSYDQYVGPDGDDTESVSRFFVAPASLSPERKELLERRLRQLDFAMFGVLAADWSIGTLLQELKLNVTSVAGHSAGELAALVAAGSIDVSKQNETMIEGMRALGDAEDRSHRAEATLLATSASREALEKLIVGIPGAIASGPDQNIFVAMDNCPHQSVVVGLPNPVSKLEEALKRDRIVCERLPFSRPYHTPLFDPFMGPLTEMFDTVEFLTPQRTIYSCSTGRPFPDDPESIRQGALAHWTSPVEFRRLIQNMYADGVRIFIEAGPRGVLSAFVQDILRGQEFVALPADLPRRSAVTQLNHLVAQLAAHHAQVDFDLLYRHREVEAIDMGPSQTQTAPVAGVAPAVSTRIEAASTTAAIAAPTPVAMSPQTARPMPTVAASGVSRAPLAGPATVMARHMDVMERFLEAQQAATRDYLQTRLPRKTIGARAAPVRTGSTPPTRPLAAAPPALSPAPAANRPRPVTAAPQSTVAPPRPATVSSAQPAQTAPPATVSPDFVPGPTATGDFPMAGIIISHTPGVEMITRRRLEMREDLYVDDHTVGGRDISRLNPEQRGMPVMPMTFILEMLAEAAARLVPGRVVIAVREIQLQRWLAFDEEAVPTVEIVAKRRPAVAAGDVVEVDVEVTNLGADGVSGSRGTVTLGVVELALNYPPQLMAQPFVLENEREARVPISTLYRNLFHGPLFRGVLSMDRYGDAQSTATIEVLPRKGLFRSTDDPKFLIDPVTLDVGMHPAAGWHLEQEDQAGRVLLPFDLKRVEFYGPRPAPGVKLHSRTVIAHSSPRQFNHCGELIYENGAIWSRMIDIRCWRFYLPFGQVNFNGPKDEYFISYAWPDAAPIEPDDSLPTAMCVRLDPSGDLTQSAMQDAAARVSLSDREMREFRTRRFAAVEKSAWLFDRVAAKDAARMWWHQQTGERQFIADLDVEDDFRGRPFVRLRNGTRPAGYPNVAVDGIVGLIFAIATSRPWAGVGVTRMETVDVESALAQLEPTEQQIVAPLAKDPRERMARVISARKAVRNALGPALISGVEQLHILEVDPKTGALTLALDREALELLPDAQGQTFVVRTFLENQAAVATFVGGPVS